ncbi:MAG: UDP-3-O-acyl-N-acetylglucosamine deacetylase [Abditibacteriales bacterium]|nr:UDP-3-O-acyl-N-acetylglucosamine deacetylase [Abditibacteriales bacterium]MDW8367488.1 UDP-3-O-acyl-N-acetylglucosamine deacetylase [Abditibacteriales bacterium]
MRKDATIQRAVQLQGVGLHSGETVTMRLLPREQPGIVFRRVDIPGQPEVAARVEHAVNTGWTTTLREGKAVVRCVEHLLAALSGLGVWRCTVELDNSDVPIADGSALPFVRLLQQAGIEEVDDDHQHQALTLREPVWVQEGDKSLLALPAKTFQVTYAVDYCHALIGRQVFSLRMSPVAFAEALAPARTFALVEWIESLQRAGLARGGSLDNAIVVYPDRYSSPLRFPDELARHKALDCVGDLALLGAPLRAHVIGIKGSHALHAELVKQIRKTIGG